jgi:hypothetical protein
MTKGGAMAAANRNDLDDWAGERNLDFPSPPKIDGIISSQWRA